MEDLAKRCERLEAQVAALLETVAALRAENQELKLRLSLNSQNSSKPPSSDMGKPKRKPPVDRSGRRPGGQPGHKGTAREAVPADQVDETVDIDPDTCANCGAPLEDAPRLDADVLQIIEAPEFQAFITAYHLWRKKCPRCGGFTRAKRPKGLPKGAFGPRLQALVSMMCGRFRLSRRETQAFLHEVMGILMSLGSVQACCESTSAAIAQTHAALHEAVKAAASAHADETGYGKCGEKRMWLWVAVTQTIELFLLQPGRGGEQAKALLGEDFAGILHRDRWTGYKHLLKALHQFCWAHLRRDFQAMLETPGETGVQGAMLKLASDRAFSLWHTFLDGKIEREELIRRMKPIQAEVRKRLVRIRDGTDCSKKARGTAKELLAQWAPLWTYLHAEGAVPTNNEAERAIRKAVLLRKGSFGVGSEAGRQFIERILTIVGTAKRRGIPILAWLTRALQADLNGDSAPALAAC